MTDATPWQGVALASLVRLHEARSAWLAFAAATTTDDHFAAVARLRAALAIKDEDDTDA